LKQFCPLPLLRQVLRDRALIELTRPMGQTLIYVVALGSQPRVSSFLHVEAVRLLAANLIERPHRAPETEVLPDRVGLGYAPVGCS
jgi:hypothetical protein